MIPRAETRDSRQVLAGAALGLYAAAVALSPGWGSKAILCVPLILIPTAWSILRTPNRWLTLFFLCALLAPPLPIALGDSGPHIAVLFAAPGLLVGLLRLEEWRFRADLVAASILTLLAIFFASVGMAAFYSGPNVAAASLARVVLFGISVYTFLYVRHGPGALNQRQSLRAIRWLFWAASLSALVACVDFYFQFPAPAGYAQQFIWLESGVFRRAQGVFYEASTFILARVVAESGSGADRPAVVASRPDPLAPFDGGRGHLRRRRHCPAVICVSDLRGSLLAASRGCI